MYSLYSRPFFQDGGNAIPTELPPLNVYQLVLNPFMLASHKRDIVKKCRTRSDAAKATFDLGLYLYIKTGISTKHGDNKND